jgi:hypothetical protein
MLYFTSVAGIPELSRAARLICTAHGSPLGLPNNSYARGREHVRLPPAARLSPASITSPGQSGAALTSVWE